MSRSPFGWDLPPGCTDADIDRAMGGDNGEEDCETCDGTGKLGSECCGAKVEQGICVKCKEHADEERCPDCKGEGIIEFSIEARRKQARDEAAEDRYDEMKDEGLL